MPTYKVVIIDEHLMVRELIRKAVAQIPSVEVVGDTGDRAECLEMLRALRPNLIVLDIALGDGSGIRLLKEVRDNFLETKILVLAVEKDRASIAAALTGGADGYILRENALDDLIQAVERVRQGELYISDLLLRHVIALLRNGNASMGPSHYRQLSVRERTVAGLIAEGKSVREIADLLSLSRTTIYNFRFSIRKKLGVKRDIDLVKKLQSISVDSTSLSG